MVTAMMYAIFSNEVYSDDPKVEGWPRIAFKASGGGLWDAFQGAAFANGNEVVVAFKGTSLKRDMVEDFKLGVGMNTTHYALATAFTSSLPISKGAKVSVCGHSLGGAIAQIVGNRNQLPFVTFNAPGVALISRNVGEVARTVMTGGAAIRTAGTVLSAVRHPVQAYQDTVAVFHKTVGANLRLEGELVSKIGVHYGRVIDVPVPDSSLGVYDLHLMKNVLEALSLSQYRDKPLEQLIG